MSKRFLVSLSCHEGPVGDIERLTIVLVNLVGPGEGLVRDGEGLLSINSRRL